MMYKEAKFRPKKLSKQEKMANEIVKVQQFVEDFLFQAAALVVFCGLIEFGNTSGIPQSRIMLL